MKTYEPLGNDINAWMERHEEGQWVHVKDAKKLLAHIKYLKDEICDYDLDQEDNNKRNKAIAKTNKILEKM